MANNSLLYEKIDFIEYNLPITLRFYKLTKQNEFHCHWHDQIELLYFVSGKAAIQCNNNKYAVKQGDLIVVNSNELHQGVCTSECVEYYCIIFDVSLLQSRHVDACEAKYVNPIFQNRILFHNKIENDLTIKMYISQLVKEYEKEGIGYELAVKANIYQLLVYLLRNDVELILTPHEYEIHMNNLKRFNRVLEYIESHYNEKITIDQLCSMANISRFHFCRLFKIITGSTMSEYLNELRINKAKTMLKEGSANVTEAALACGFNNLNYFSRLYKKQQGVSPSSVGKSGK